MFCLGHTQHRRSQVLLSPLQAPPTHLNHIFPKPSLLPWRHKPKEYLFCVSVLPVRVSGLSTPHPYQEPILAAPLAGDQACSSPSPHLGSGFAECHRAQWIWSPSENSPAPQPPQGGCSHSPALSGSPVLGPPSWPCSLQEHSPPPLWTSKTLSFPAWGKRKCLPSSMRRPQPSCTYRAGVSKGQGPPESQ